MRRDDGIGWIVLDILQANPEPDTQYRRLHQLMPELAADLAKVDQVVFVDASVVGAPGTVSVQPVSAATQRDAHFTHYVSPGELLALAGAVYSSAPAGTLITVTGEDFNFGEELSEIVAARVGEVVAQVRTIVREKDQVLASG